VFSEFQSRVNEIWKRRTKQVDPGKQRRLHLCPKCGKQGFRVKMDYLGNKHVQAVTTVYDVSFYRCPRCKYEHKDYARIEGKGTSGVNAGAMFGGI